jgi:hypothetical protein
MNIVSILTTRPFLFVVIGTLSKTVDGISEKFNMEMPIGEYYMQTVFTLETSIRLLELGLHSLNSS